ncbi:2,3-dihydroxyphenylpropionate/2, 3-dihydroxicinnamic acid 1,2-dioxygenase [Variovorax sp. PBS-H4]|nr:2,3-dihydroxyphenylpropionate/2, 3-dihydroxicinnamic acid 1,2-dioxygenase [Variovorax sp. PBS-H4]
MAEIDAQIEAVRDRVRAFAPELVVLFAPDHFNGFFYDLMPPFCIGTAASAIGDFGTVAGELSVPTALASACAASLLEQGIDVAVSHRMRVDHGFANPLQDIFGGLAEVAYCNGKFFSQYRVVKAALPHLASGGTITLTSGVASRGTMANHSAISAVNAAIEACVRQLAKELAPRRLNAVAPGVTATTTYDAMTPAAKEDFVKKIAAKVPLQRIASAEEVALAYIFAMKSGYVSGSVIDVSGGQLVA